MVLQLIIIAFLGIVLYWYGTRNFNYWKKRGVKHRTPFPFFGTNAMINLGQRSITQQTVQDYYNFPNEKVVGWFRSSRPEITIRDPEIIHRMLATDFNHFYPRGFLQERTEIEPLMKNIFFADGDLWRLLRQRITPAFTSGKLKAMFPLIIERAEHLQERLQESVAVGKPIDARDLMARFTTDFIGACGFGLNADSLHEEDSIFRNLGVRIFKITPSLVLRFMAKEIMPQTFKHVRLMAHVEDDVKNLVNQILIERDYKPSGRNDFIDLMLECQQKGLMTGESIEKNVNGIPEKISLELTNELIAAQVFVFFGAGFETSSSATSFSLHQLAWHPEIQKNVQADINKVLAKYNNKLSYDAIKEMTYLDWTFKEAMRLFPSVGFLKRECAKKYKIPGLDVTIDEGVGIIIPVHALHHDPKYFKDPEEFRPERFSPENFTEEIKRVYLAFGAGPRACVGERLGHMQSLAGLAAVLSRFTVTPAPNTLRHPEIDPTSSIVQSFKSGLPLYFRERKEKSL